MSKNKNTSTPISISRDSAKAEAESQAKPAVEEMSETPVSHSHEHVAAKPDTPDLRAELNRMQEQMPTIADIEEVRTEISELRTMLKMHSNLLYGLYAAIIVLAIVA